MKKSLVALAALAVVGAASAQSSVTLSGIVDVGFKETSAPANIYGSASKNEFNFNNTATSALFFKGTEDLGSGLTANFLLELDINPTQSATTDTAPSNAAFYNGTPFNGEQWASLAGGFGDLKIGTPNSAALVAGVTAQPFGTAMGGGYSAGFGRLGSQGLGINQFVGGPSASNRLIRHEKTAMYTTPVFGGFKGTVEYAIGNDNVTNVASAPATTGAANSERYTALSAQYNNGPLNAIYSYSNVKLGGNGVQSQFTITSLGVFLPGSGYTTYANTDVTYHALSANYTFGPATVYAGYTKTLANAPVVYEDATSWNIAGKYAVTPSINLMANYLVRNTNLATANNARLIGVGADYMLSKRTTVYARYENVDLNTSNNAGAAAAVITAGGSVTTGTSVGLKVTF